MSPTSKREVLRAIHPRYRKATGPVKSQILEELCAITGYHRKYAIGLLNKPRDEVATLKRKKRGPTYSPKAIRVLQHIWEAGGYPWSERLKAMLPVWLPWARQRFSDLTAEVECQLLAISPRQIDRRLKDRKRALGRRIYGRTKPGTLLKHHIPIKTDNWDICEPGFTEIDLVSHSGPSASGEFVYSLNVTDIETTWVETCAVKGRGEIGVADALKEIRAALPFDLRGIDSDNGSEFINQHLYRYCQDQHIQFTRARPYKKDDNAHIEQKNWTHVRKILAWDRYDSKVALQAINDLYRNELRLMMNLFQPSVKLKEKTRIGSRIKRIYDKPQTPLDRLAARYKRKPKAVRQLLDLRQELDPFELAKTIETKLAAIYELRNKMG